jgi:hypothetical protein
MNRALLTLITFATLSLAACSPDRTEPEGEDEDLPPVEQTTPSDPAAPPSAAPPAAPGAPPGTEQVAPADRAGTGERMSYAACMEQARAAEGPVRARIEESCKRLPDAPK